MSPASGLPYRAVPRLVARQPIPASSELVLMALVRAAVANCCRPGFSMAIPICFFQGLLSLIDVMLEIPMPAGWKEFRRPGDQASVLLGGASLRPLYQLMPASESGDWQAVSERSPELHLSESDVPEAYWMPWSGRGGLVRRRTSTTGHGPSGGKLKLLCPCAGARAWLPFKCSQRP